MTIIRVRDHCHELFPSNPRGSPTVILAREFENLSIDFFNLTDEFPRFPSSKSVKILATEQYPKHDMAFSLYFTIMCVELKVSSFYPRTRV